MKQKLGTEQLTLGMYVAELDRPWLETPFLFQGFMLQSPAEIELLRELCRYVYIDVRRSRTAVAPAQAEPAGAEPSAATKVSAPASSLPRRNSDRKPSILSTAQLFSQWRVARTARRHARRCLDTLMEDVRLGRSVDTAQAQETVRSLAETVSANAAAALWMTNLKNRDEYTSIHCLNVCVLSIAFAHHLGLPPRLVEVIGLGALLHDIGKMKVPDTVLNKPGRLTEEEFATIREHPVHGYELVEKSGDVPPEALEIIRHHHERLDGRGYPDGLSGQAVKLHMMITSIADIYDAVTSDRCYHRGRPANEGLKILYKMAPDAFGRDLVEEFIRCIGIYPVGSLVKFKSGALGVVVASEPGRRLEPVVLLVRDEHGEMVMPRPLLNLSVLNEVAGRSAKYVLTGLADPEEHGIDLTAIVRSETALASV